MRVPRLFPDFDGDAYEPHPSEVALRAEVRAFIDEEIARDRIRPAASHGRHGAVSWLTLIYGGSSPVEAVCHA